MNMMKQRGFTGRDHGPDTEIERTTGDLRRDFAALQETGGDSELAANSVSSLLRRLSETPTQEIGTLISELQTLRDRLQADGRRIERELAEYATFNQSVGQLTKIIGQGVTRVKTMPGSSHGDE